MTIEQAIEHAEEVAIQQAKLMDRYDAASGYNRSGNGSIRTESAKECEQCAAEHRQLAAWLRELRERRKAPERVKGRWIEISSINHTYKCSECGRILVNVADGRNNVSKHYPYCHCGADMKGEPNE